MDFYKIVERSRRGEIDIYPDFRVSHVTDLLVRGKDFYAVWNAEKGLWSTDILDVSEMVDADLWSYADKLKNERHFDGFIHVKTMESDSTGSWSRFVQYLKRYPDSNVRLDENLTFANTKVTKDDYVSRRLPYSLEEGDCSAWDELISRLYEPSEREKIEWAIGAIVSGDSKRIQKFCVLYGEPGTGKGTVIDIIQKLFPGYYTTFDAKALGSSNNQFATEVFRTNPLVAIQHDGDLSRIEDNTRINSIISHEVMVINEKNKPQYMGKANCFLFLGTNRPVKITDAKSGIIRRLIDITPKSKKNSPIPPKEYDALMSRIDFELGAIAWHCLSVYRELGKNYYKSYTPKEMIMKTDVFYNFVEANFDTFVEQSDGISLKQAYAMYKEYCDDALVEFKLPRHKFREELKNYFDIFEEVSRIDGKQVRSWYRGFIREKLEAPVLKKEEHSLPLVLDCDESLLDDILADCPAQYATNDANEKPMYAWSDVKTALRDIDTKRTHYIWPKLTFDGKQLVMIDFDLKNAKGEKDMLLNLEAASKWPKTYAEFSKGGNGVHLIYWYGGDIGKLKPLYSEGIEIKAFPGKSSMRRRLSKCNNVPVAEIASLPEKEDKVLDVKELEGQDHLRNIINKCLRKENHGNTTQEVNLILHVLEKAYASGMTYDVSDMEHDILSFAMNSTNQSSQCVKQVAKMPFVSKDLIEERTKAKDAANEKKPIAIFDIEVFPNLLLVNYKELGEKPMVRLINPAPRQIEEMFMKYRLVGFNCRKYDNHILYARYLGTSIEDLYNLSQRIIVEQAREAFYPEAYNLSYTDIYDFCSKKQSLKKWEIELGIHHMELGLQWDKPVPENLWGRVSEYCDNDVLATEAVWNARHDDFIAREILADIAEGSVNDTTNQLTTKIIFGTEKHPKLVYTDLATGERTDGSKSAVINSFPGYEYTFVKGDPKPRNMYRGVDLGFGGYVYSEPGIYTDVALLDVQSMHPNSAVNLNYFGEYTSRFKDILDARVAIKNGDFEKAKTMFNGRLAKYLTDSGSADQLAGALKIAINSVYGLTSASFDNPFKDRRNVNNIVALRGALFMKTLQDEVRSRGFTVAHIKTDSIKIPNATPEIIHFCLEFAKKYGYIFEHEATYDRMCLVDMAQYIAAYKRPEACEALYGYSPKDNVKHFKKHGHPWTATGAQFQQPYVFKTLFSGEPVTFDDLCETKTVTGGAIYLDMNEGFDDVTAEEEELSRRIFNASNPDKKPKRLNPAFASKTDDEIRDDISKGHDYRFVGRAGLFFPVKEGAGGGVMYREKDGKYYAVTGTKGYRWLEAEDVESTGREPDLDPRYHNDLVADAVFAISKYGDFDRFIADKPYETPKAAKKPEPPVDIPELPFDDDPPWTNVPCGDGKYETCTDCPECKGDICRRGYSLSTYFEKGGEGK